MTLHHPQTIYATPAQTLITPRNESVPNELNGGGNWGEREEATRSATGNYAIPYD